MSNAENNSTKISIMLRKTLIFLITRQFSFFCPLQKLYIFGSKC